eukprot:scaffold10491_cov81-Cyclotella_meneghiniana.AAC.6
MPLQVLQLRFGMKSLQDLVKKIVLTIPTKLLLDNFRRAHYYTPLHGDKILVAGGKFHPIRPTKDVFDKFLSYFDIVFNNCVGHFTIDGWVERNNGERGYYVVARKKDIAIAP